MDTDEDRPWLRYRSEISRLESPAQQKPIPRVESYSLMPQTENKNLEVPPLPPQDDADKHSRFPGFKKSPLFSAEFSKNFTPRHNWWLFEILAAIVSIAAMGSLLGLLSSYNNTVVQHMSYGITLNGLVAVLSTISRTSLMIPVASCLSQGKWLYFSQKKETLTGRRLKDLETFDNASRGSWGSLELLWALKASHIASFGALVTILTLAFDAFTQQVLSTKYSTALVPSPESSGMGLLQVPRSESYTILNETDNTSRLIPDWPTENAIYNGIFSSNISDLQAPCHTGNCTYPIVPSLGVCGGCQSLPVTSTDDCKSADPNRDHGMGNCTFTLPDGQFINVALIKGFLQTQFRIMNTDGTHYAYDRTNITIPYILNFQVVGMPFHSVNWTYSQLSASECALWYCVQAYNISVENNVQKQSIVDTWSNITPWNSQQNSMANITFADIPEHFNTAPNTSFVVNTFAETTTSVFLRNMFDGLAQVDWPFGFEYDGNWTEPIWYGFRDPDRFIANLSRSMTNNMRTTSPAPASKMYEGQAFREKLLVHVRWPWMVLPIALVLFSVSFLIVTILETRGSNVNAWKSSALALLFLDVGQGIKSSARDKMDEVNGLKDVAEKSQVVLREEDGLWGFREPGVTT